MVRMNSFEVCSSAEEFRVSLSIIVVSTTDHFLKDTVMLPVQ
jgi:hypothetical protein